MAGTELRYHVPLLGHVVAPLHAESEQVFQSLAATGEVDRLKGLDHLGLMRSAWEGAHHSRWEYTILILSLIERCRSISQVHLSSPVRLESNQFSSGYELLKAWALLLNTGHLEWTFAAERALMLETWANRPQARVPYLDALRRFNLGDFPLDVLRRGRTYRFFQTLTFIRMPNSLAQGDSLDLWSQALAAYVLPGMSEQMVGLQRVYRNLRRLAYLALDTHYTPSVVTLDLMQPLTDSDTLARLALRDTSRETDELDGLASYLDRETYLGRRVIEEMAARESALRNLIRASIRRSSLTETVEALAFGRLQEQVVPVTAKTVLRVSGDSAGGLSEYWPASPSARVEQESLDRETSRASALCLYWKTAGGTDWVLQSHALVGSSGAVVAAFYPIWRRAVEAHARARADLQRVRLADVYSESLASTLIDQALPLFFSAELDWEWGIAGSSGKGLLLRRSDARRILGRDADFGEVSTHRLAELRMLARTLRGRPSGYVAVALAPLIAYRGAEQVAELDGCFVECDEERLRLTVVEAKQQRRGASGAAEQTLRGLLRRLQLQPGVDRGNLDSELARRGLARASITLAIGA